jgi:hypothetical protein
MDLATAARTWLAAAATLVAACAPAEPAHTAGAARADSPQAPATGSPLSVFAEGLCPKLDVYAAGEQLFLVYGTYGLDAVPYALGGAKPADVTAAQALVSVDDSTLRHDAALMAGLPTMDNGYVAGDLELGGVWPDAAWLTRIDTRRGSGRVLYERQREYYGWRKGQWQHDRRARDAAIRGAMAPPLPEGALCDELGTGLRFATYAAERAASGDALVAGRCEDDLHRATGGVRLARYLAGDNRWGILDAPPSEVLDSIVNLGLVTVGRQSAFLYAYPPYASDDERVYLHQLQGARWQPVAVPFRGPIVSLAATADGALWAVAGWSELWRRDKGQWRQVGLPAPRFVAPRPKQLKLLGLDVVAGSLWLHAAYPVALEAGERRASRGHMLLTTRPVPRPVYCDRRRPPGKALSARGVTLKGADQLKKE